MATRLFQCIRKELVSPLLEQPKSRFSSSSSGPAGGSGGSSSKSSKPELTQNEKRVQTALKVLAVFLPGMYIGHVLTDQGIIGTADDNENGKDKKDKDSKNKDKDSKKKDSKDED